MNWQGITIGTNNEAVEAIADILISAGADGVQIEEKAIVYVTAYYENNEHLATVVAGIESRIQHLKNIGINVSPGTVTLQNVSQTDWEDNWKQYYHSQRITRHLTVVPSWETFKPKQTEEKPIIMDPKLAFGTGTHETTRLIMQALESVVRGGESMIDVGTGSGVLAVAAKQLGVQSVLATDIDEMSTVIARENLRLNPIANDIKVVMSDLLVNVETEPVDLIVANILADVIERLIPQTIPMLKANGYFLVSGIYDAIAPHIEEQLTFNGYTIIQKSQMGDWHSYIAQLKGSE